MRKICLVVVGLYLSLLSAFSQDTSQYKSKKLNIDEINFVSSYYHQNGDNSGVTGGIGTEKLTDIANIIEVQMSNFDSATLKKKTLDVSLGVDHYTSASSDNIDPHTISSASSRDTRIYPSASWSVENEKKRTTVGFNVSASHEFDYLSLGLGASFSKESKDRSREFTLKMQAYLDQVTIILPIELRKDTISSQQHHINYPTSPRDSYSASLSLSQIINKRLQVLFLTDITYQQGFLSLPFYRVYFNNNTEKTELLPSQRFKLPVGARANYFLGNSIIIRSFYRFYVDDWGITSHTIDLETAIKITPFFSVAPFYRFYTQTAVNYFAPYKMHAPTDQYYTSDYDLSAFHSNFIGTGFRISPPKGILGEQNWSMLEIRYGHYMQSNTLNSDIISLNLKFK
jgi:hypothetical protein